MRPTPRKTNGQDIDGDGDDDVEPDDIADAEHFSVSSNGALSFESPPNFEVPSGGGEGGTTSNTYKVVVQASDGGVTSWVNWFKVTVTVTDVEEDGTVTWTVDPDGTDGVDPQNLRQFQAGADLTASLTDPDNVATGYSQRRNSGWYKLEMVPVFKQHGAVVGNI